MTATTTETRGDDIYELTEDQRDWKETLREFADKEIAPRAAKYDDAGEFPWESVKKMRELSLFGLLFPEQYGGQGAGTLEYAMAVEEVSRACASTGITLAAHVSLGTWPIYAFGTEEQKKKYLPALCSGEKLASFGLTEPEAGSDAGGTKTRAVKEGDHWVVNGRKIYITNGSVSGTTVFTAVTTPGKGVKGISSFIVEQGTPGFSPGTREKKLGHRASDTVELIFENMKIPAGNQLGGEGEGFVQFMKTLDGGRISIGAMSLGIAQASLDASVKYSKERKQFGRSIGDFQIPSEFLQALPYVVTIIVVAGAVGRAVAPAADGVPFGAIKPFQPGTTKPLRPSSVSGLTFGKLNQGPSPVWPMPTTRPSSIRGLAVVRNIRSMRPATKSGMAGASPR
jgi:alkylation response protein AidB-like acyl-CoA dehydrogenase